MTGQAGEGVYAVDVIAQIVLQLGVGAAMAVGVLWFLRHLITVTFPDMTRTFREELQEERKFRQAMGAEFSASLRMLSDSWQRREEILQAELREIRDAVERLAEGLGKRRA